MSEPVHEVEVTLADGRQIRLTRRQGRIALVVDDMVVLEVERGDAWELAEALDRLATEP